MKRAANRALPFAFAVALCATVPAGAVVPRPGPGDPRIHVVDFDPTAVVELRGALGFQMSVEFDPLERIENVAIGDSLGWQVTPNRRANLLFIKPMSNGPDTNMTVVTNLRRYNFQLSVRPRSAIKQVPFTVRFLYPPPLVALVEAPPPPPPPEERNRNYTYQGSTKSLPVKIFDDGEATYFAFKSHEDIPAIYAVDPDGQEAVVNSHEREGLVVVDRIARGFVLRRGAEVTRIFNDGFPAEEASTLRSRPKEPWWRR